ncbi:phage shock protein PspA [Aliikangiella coralliicola]|uniref:Phage shock protein PspA n=1 Tax=Aliikangiella coralliicola TaxID=2592383 RepID=A0A545UAW9_9GAMM|nr:phage shock protein PspA [Aliikangiella coralliicola]TQV86609.1 phage shock protein PspA [Aliikangiella coralliicola]
MGIFSRFADIVNANINALLDKAEDPEKLIRLIVQEMEDTLVEVRTSSARTIAEKKDITRRIEFLKAEAGEWERKAELAITKGREDLAKSALLERNKATEVADELQLELDKVENELARLSAEVSQLQEKLDDARARQKALLMRHKTTSSRLKVKRSLYDSSAEDAVTRFDRFERKLDELESEVESFDVGRNKNLADEINDLEKEDELDRHLAELKSRVNKSSKSTKETK